MQATHARESGLYGYRALPTTGRPSADATMPGASTSANGAGRTGYGELEYLNMRHFLCREELLKLEVSQDIASESIRQLRSHIAGIESRINEIYNGGSR